MSEWISVKDGLPEDGRMVDVWRTYDRHNDLVGGPKSQYYIPPKRVTNLRAKKANDSDGTEDYIILVGGGHEYCHLNGEYSHWMPVPEPPQEDPEEDDTYSGDDPRQDQESVARCRENWGGRWPG